MPAEIMTAVACASNFGTFTVIGSKGDPYTVQFAGVEGPAHCDCLGFRFQRTCSHITKTYNKACMWNPQWNDGRPDPLRPDHYDEHNEVPNQSCPACGGPVVAIRIAV